LCAAKVPQDGQYSSPKVTFPFIDHSSEMWNFAPQWAACSPSFVR
jgi:hypothetical protein